MGQKASLYYSGKEFSSSANVREAQLAEHEVSTGSGSLRSLWGGWVRVPTCVGIATRSKSTDYAEQNEPQRSTKGTSANESNLFCASCALLWLSLLSCVCNLRNLWIRYYSRFHCETAWS